MGSLERRGPRPRGGGREKQSEADRGRHLEGKAEEDRYKRRGEEPRERGSSSSSEKSAEPQRNSRTDSPRERGQGRDSERQRMETQSEARQRQREGIIKSFDAQNGPKTAIALCGGDSGVSPPGCPWFRGSSLGRTGVLHRHFVSNLSWSTLLGPTVHPIF